MINTTGETNGQVQKPKLPLVRVLLFVVIILIAILLIAGYSTQSSEQTKASQEAVTVSIPPVALIPNQPQTFNIKIAPETAGKKISGFELRFAPSLNLSVVAVGTPILIPDTASASLTSIVKTNNVVTYFIKAPAKKLPLLVSVPVTVVTTDQVPFDTLSLNLSAQVTGPVASSTYAIGSLDKGDFTIAPVPSGYLLPIGPQTMSPTRITTYPVNQNPTLPAVGQFMPSNRVPPQQ